MTRIELGYDGGCPDVEQGRERLRSACDALSLPRRWQEWDRRDPGSPPRVRGCSCVTILVNGRREGFTVSRRNRS